jgi:transcriptional regulatory protein LevR
MGSLKEIYEEIKLHLHGELLVINNVSTAMALDIAAKIQDKLSMEAIIESAKERMRWKRATTRACCRAIKSLSPASPAKGSPAS